MTKPPSFQWYPKECDTDENVRLMDDAEFGFYMRCLNHAWLNDGLPESMDDIARLMSRPTVRIRAYWERVGKCFILTDRWRNPKQEQQRKEAQEYQESRRAASNQRWEEVRKRKAQKASTCNARALRVESSASASASASAIPHVADAKTAVEMEARQVVEMVKQDEFRRIFDSAWAAHRKHSQRETKQHVLQMALGWHQDGKLDMSLLESRHGPYVKYWDKRGWDFSSLTLLGWIENDMPAPPPEAQAKRSKWEELQERLSQ